MKNDLTLSDVTFLIDTREQRPWDFTDLNDDQQSIRVRQKTQKLKTGDYGIEGFPEICCERKSLDDLLGVTGGGRSRFERELTRMAQFRFKCVVVEASWDAVKMGMWRSEIPPKTLMGTIYGWSLMSGGIPFWFENVPYNAMKLAARWMFIAARRIQRERNKEAVAV